MCYGCLCLYKDHYIICNDSKRVVITCSNETSLATDVNTFRLIVVAPDQMKLRMDELRMDVASKSTYTSLGFLFCIQFGLTKEILPKL